MFETVKETMDYITKKKAEALEKGFARVARGIYLQTVKDIKDMNPQLKDSFIFYDAEDDDVYIVSNLHETTLVVPFDMQELVDELYFS